jgi:hypothetical protein
VFESSHNAPRYAVEVPAGRDDDALTWDGDDDPTLDARSRATAPGEDITASTPAEPSSGPGDAGALPDGFTAVGKGSESLHTTPTTDADGQTAGKSRPPLSNGALIGLGIFGGVYLLLTVGWLLGVARLQLVAGLFLDSVAFQFAFWLAVAALPLWFVTVLWFTRTSATWVRFSLLGAGAVLLIPWPFVLAGAAL